MAKLHSSWNTISVPDYERLWSHTYEAYAETVLDEIREREVVASEKTSTDAPYDPKLMDKWQHHVFVMRKLISQNA